MDKIILASQSPRRKQLLEWAEIPFEIVVRETDESYPGGLSLDKVAMHIARNKLLAVLELIGSRFGCIGRGYHRCSEQSHHRQTKKQGRCR